jgi:DNA-binding CsgD family transcriptional regulator
MGAATTVELLDPQIGCTLLDAAGGPQLASMLLSAAHSLGGVDEVFGYRRVMGKPPEVLVTASMLDDSATRVDLYRRRFHHHDPAIGDAHLFGSITSFARQIPASAISQAEYRAICFEKPRFLDKLSFGWRGVDGLTMISFYRRNPGDAKTLQRLSALAGFSLTALARHKQRSSSADSVAERIEIRIARSFPALSMRERQVCSRTLAGQTAEAIGEALGIGMSTVITYRKRAYQRLGFSQASDFLAAVLD